MFVSKLKNILVKIDMKSLSVKSCTENIDKIPKISLGTTIKF